MYHVYLLLHFYQTVLPVSWQAATLGQFCFSANVPVSLIILGSWCKLKCNIFQDVCKILQYPSLSIPTSALSVPICITPSISTNIFAWRSAFVVNAFAVPTKRSTTCAKAPSSPAPANTVLSVTKTAL